ncbi:methionine--tRNA ligase subunit beta [Patescibacteria group bacterium]|nr:methionine--tRNA ligase subunit beta [Patescibacteria group bacterium]
MAVTIDQFSALEIRIGTVASAERVPDSDKLLRLTVDFGEETHRQILSGIAEYIQPEDLVGRQFPFVTNLEPRVIRGHVSNGMLLAIGDDGIALMSPSRAVRPGAEVR